MTLLKVVLAQYRWSFLGVIFLSLVSAGLGIGVIAYINQRLIAHSATVPLDEGLAAHVGVLPEFLGLILLLLAITAPSALLFGFFGAASARSRIWPVAWFGKGYIAIVRGVPDIAFFLFFVIALDQLFEAIRHKVKCPDWDQAIWQGNDFVVCQAAKLPLGNAPQWMHETYGFFLAVLTFAIVFGAFAANVLFGAMRAVPHAQLETAAAYGHNKYIEIRFIF